MFRKPGRNHTVYLVVIRSAGWLVDGGVVNGRTFVLASGCAKTEP